MGLELWHWMKHAIELLGEDAPRHDEEVNGRRITLWNMGEVRRAMRGKGLEVPEHGVPSERHGGLVLVDKEEHRLVVGKDEKE